MKFRKKPVEVEAMQYMGGKDNNLRAIQEFMGEGKLTISFKQSDIDPDIIIHTLEGDMRASESDMIIKGIRGEFYPCKLDIFDKTYEPVDSTNDTTTIEKSVSNIEQRSMSYDGYLNSLINTRA